MKHIYTIIFFTQLFNLGFSQVDTTNHKHSFISFANDTSVLFQSMLLLAVINKIYMALMKLAFMFRKESYSVS